MVKPHDSDRGRAIHEFYTQTVPLLRAETTDDNPYLLKFVGQQASSALLKQMHWPPSIIWREIGLAYPRNRSECRQFGEWYSLALSYVSTRLLNLDGLGEALAITTSAIEDTKSEWSGLFILAGQSQPLDSWLNHLIRISAGTVVQYFGGNYKKYHALPGYKQEEFLDSLEQKAFTAFEEELFSSWVPSFKNYFQTVKFVQSLSKDLKLALEPFAPRELMMIIAHALPFILSMGLEHLMTELDNKRGRLRRQIKRKIYDIVSHAGDEITRDLETYYDYRSRREDYHLSQFGFLLLI